MGPPPRTAAPNPGVPDERARVADERYVHPRHGICRVIGRQERKVGDGMRTYVELQVDASPSGRAALTMLLPEDELMEHVRDVAAEEVADAALAAMNDKQPSDIEGASSWRARVAKAETSLEVGDLVELARVLRDFAVQDADSGLSNSERRIADHIRDLVVGELVGAKEWTVEHAVEVVEERLASASAAA